MAPRGDAWTVVAGVTAALALAALVLLVLSKGGVAGPRCKRNDYYDDEEGFQEGDFVGGFWGPRRRRGAAGVRPGCGAMPGCGLRTYSGYRCGCGRWKCGGGAACGLLPDGGDRPWPLLSSAMWGGGKDAVMRQYYANDRWGDGYCRG